ncbi:MAG: cupin domain-containing protein [Succinivibrio sp.]
MKGIAGEAFGLGGGEAVAGCTMSQELSDEGEASLMRFTLAPGTGISKESHPFAKIWIVLSGSGTARADGLEDVSLEEGMAYAAPAGVPCGIETSEGISYIEAVPGEGAQLPGSLKEGSAIRLAGVLPSLESRILNMDLAKSPLMKLALMSFGQGTGLPEHSAPGDALVMALDGEGIIGYEGKEHPIRAGEGFMFKKGGAHFVKAPKPFKMALLVNLPR